MLKSLIFGNFWTKVMALFLAVFVWVYLDIELKEVVIREVGFLLDSPSDIKILGVENEKGEEIKDKITVELTAPRGLLSAIKSKDIRCIHRLETTNIPIKESITVSEYIKSDDFDVPVGVTVRPLPSEKLTIKLVSTKIPQSVKTITIPINFSALPNLPFAVDIEPQEVKVKLEGPDVILNELLNDIKISQVLSVFTYLKQDVSNIKIGDVLQAPLKYSFIGKEYSEIKVTLMPDAEPQNRFVKIKIKEK